MKKSLLALILSCGCLQAIPTLDPKSPLAPGISISSSGASTLAINQTSRTAIINWSDFSIAKGELTQFFQPHGGATLNRVTGGNISDIEGTLTSTGQLYLINQNGILIGKSGVVNAGGFTASTRDITDEDFNKNNRHFVGSNNNGVTNQGLIRASTGNVYLIGKNVSNLKTGSIIAKGTVGLAAADEVYLSQNPDGSTVIVKANPHAKASSGQTGVLNQGYVQAASAELRAANGNLYALAVNNSGTIRAVTPRNEGGHIWLVGDHGTLKNTGTLDASGVTGGTIETSDDNIGIYGNITAGDGGNWTIDPLYNIIISKGYAPLPNINVYSIEYGLAHGTNVFVPFSASTVAVTLTVRDFIIWNTKAKLTLNANGNIIIGNFINAHQGTLVLNSKFGSIVDNSTIDVGTFQLTSGNWFQDALKLPVFIANNFIINPGATFLRVNRGNGTAINPYLVTDIYGLQGIGGFPTSYFLQSNNIDASVTTNWNNGAGFIPIQNFAGTYNGVYNTITGLTISQPAADDMGLFGSLVAGGTIKELNLTKCTVTGQNNVGGLVGNNAGLVENCSYNGIVNGTQDFAGGLIGLNTGTVKNSFAIGSVNAFGGVGGLVGVNQGGSVTDCYASETLTGTGTGFVAQGMIVGSNSLLTGQTSQISNNYWVQTAPGQFGVGNEVVNGTPSNTPDNNGATGLTLAQTKVTTSYDSTWNFNPKTGYWAINPKVNGGLPYLLHTPVK